MAKANGMKKKPMGSFIRYIPCRAEPGMFRDELLVYLQGLDFKNPEVGIRVQLLVDRREVKNLNGEPKRNKPASGWLQVTLANEERGIAEVILPQPAQPVGESMLVDSSELREEVGT